MGMIEARLAELGIALPRAAAPVANYVAFVLEHDTLVVSGQLALGQDGTLDAAHKGKLGADVAGEAGTAAARNCAINVLAPGEGGAGRPRPDRALHAPRRLHQRDARLHRPSPSS